eukprot:scpid36947/ scgid32446/ 
MGGGGGGEFPGGSPASPYSNTGAYLPAVPAAVAALGARSGRLGSSPDVLPRLPTPDEQNAMAAFEPRSPSPGAMQALVSLLPAEVLETVPAEVLADPKNFNLIAELVDATVTATSKADDQPSGDAAPPNVAAATGEKSSADTLSESTAASSVSRLVDATAATAGLHSGPTGIATSPDGADQASSTDVTSPGQ